MNRHPDWQSRLQALVSARLCAPFAWGANDCCLFACDAALAVTGIDPAAAERGTYSTERQAARLLARLGGVRAIGAARFGPETIPAAAQVGDVGVVETGGRESLAVCGGAHWLAPGELGLERLPLEAASAVWRAC
ncbi:MAG: hypothetical protein EOP35_02570 [Rubrivivax sp.]|nr:MAG: hypothetical protein EOP35_02570 [Rubrivivax sp.]